MKYKVKIVETYSRTVEVEAESEDEAYNIVDDKVSEGEIDLIRDGEGSKIHREIFVFDANNRK